MLHIQGFSKHYGDLLALSIQDLRFDSGVYWIKGENGSGKTTFFKSIAGLLPCAGEVSLGGDVSLHRHPVAYRKLVNYSEAEPLYPGFLTAKDIFQFVGHAKQASGAQQQELLASFGITAYYEKPCETYSSGMLKKLSLAMAFLGSPQVIILDEPLITLDETARTILLNKIRELVTLHNVTFLMSSHQALEQKDVPVQGIYTVRDKTIVPG